MRWLKPILILSALTQLACGVKGDPIAPEKPPALGRSRPTYKRATEGLKIEKTPRHTKPGDKDDDDRDDDDKE
jgi:hypothetical protein